MIKNIAFGVKISTKNLNFLPEIYANQEIIDFIEIILDPEFLVRDIYTIKDIKIPYAIHLPNSNNGIDFGDLNKKDNNTALIKRINQNLVHFNKLTPICYIVHPESGDADLSIQNIRKLEIGPLAMENMPYKGIHGRTLLGYDPNTLKIYFDQIKNLEFCFDLNHAIKAAISIKKDYITVIEEFLQFKNPILFHISGGNLNVEIDEHLALDAGQYDISKIKNKLLNYKHEVQLTFETPRNYEMKINDDLKNMNFFKEASSSK